MGYRKPDLTPSAPPPSTEELLALAARHLDDARRHQMEAAKALDAAGATRPGWHLACSTDAIDDARALLTEGAG